MSPSDEACAANPFEDHQQIRDVLYGTEHRLDARSSALIRAKVAGTDLTAAAGEAIAGRVPAAATVLDVGSGRGSLTTDLASRLPHARIVAADISLALLRVVARRSPGATRLAADFRALPLRPSSFDAVAALFCLYHASDPASVVAGLGAVLRPGGVAVFATKSSRSYAELHHALLACGVEPPGREPPDLYRSFDVDNAEAIVAGTFTVERRIRQEHRFTFRTPCGAAAYVVTSPAYTCFRRDPASVARSLASTWAASGLECTSEVVLLICRSPR